jgi:hypothetical protein
MGLLDRKIAVITGANSGISGRGDPTEAVPRARSKRDC